MYRTHVDNLVNLSLANESSQCVRMVHESIRLHSVGIQIRKLVDGIELELPCTSVSRANAMTQTEKSELENKIEYKKYHVPQNDMIVILSNTLHHHRENGFGKDPGAFDEV